MTLRPAPANTGIVFRRLDLPEPVDVPADGLERDRDDARHDARARLAKVGTVEHLMSAMAGLGIDNAFVDLTAAEVPIMDGSAAPFVFLLQSAGIEEQNAPKRFIRVLKRVEVAGGRQVGAARRRTTVSASTSRSISSIRRCASTARP